MWWLGNIEHGDRAEKSSEEEIEAEKEGKSMCLFCIKQILSKKWN